MVRTIKHFGTLLQAEFREYETDYVREIVRSYWGRTLFFYKERFSINLKMLYKKGELQHA